MQRRYFRQTGLDAWALGHVPHYVTSHPAMAKAYAEVALGFWRDLKARDMLSSQPLYIIELGAGSGRFAYHFLLQFIALFDAIRDPEDKVCYVMTDFSTDTVSQWRQRLHTELSPFVEQGRLDFAVWDAETDSQLELQSQGICLEGRRASQLALGAPHIVPPRYLSPTKGNRYQPDSHCQPIWPSPAPMVAVRRRPTLRRMPRPWTRRARLPLWGWINICSWGMRLRSLFRVPCTACRK
jgi:hypothetical protein